MIIHLQTIHDSQQKTGGLKMEVVILGSGGHGKVVLDVVAKAGFSVLAFLDDDSKRHNKKIHGIRILGGLDQLESLAQKLPLGAIVGIGDNLIREKIYQKAKSTGITMITAVHSDSYVHSSVVLGHGTVVMPKGVINIDAKVEENCIVNTGAIIEHDCVIDSNTHIAPGARLSGEVKIGKNVLVGAGAIILPKVKVGENSIIGAGSVVLNDVPDHAVVAGNPARVIRKTENV